MTSSLLSLQAVSKSYWRGPSEVRVLTGACLDVQAGEFVAVWGKRGAGKTTLLRIAAGLEAPDSGTVRFDSEDLSMVSDAEHARLMREQVAWVGRARSTSELPILDYVALPLLAGHSQREARRRASAALRRVGMSELGGALWDSLSDGERTLVAIAHGIARKPRLLLVDDPAANLGVRDREGVMELLRSLVEEANLAVLMTVPDMPAAMRSHQLRALSAGRLLMPSPPPPERASNVIDFPSGARSAS
jgi:putative ABC transport system ATP-binding protein